MTDVAVAETPDVAQAKAGKFLTFRLAGEEYGLAILNVREIISLCEVTVVPQTPRFVKGVINLRGKVIPIVDLRLKFAMAEADHTVETCIIVVNVGERETGIVVDKVLEVLDISAGDIQPPPSLGKSVDTGFILGLGKPAGRVTILLDIEKVLTGTDLGAGPTVAQPETE
jgi:purine-binding chemotaxis protein CheW